MQERSVRFVAVFAVLAMIVTPMAAMSFENDDSDATDVDYTKYYYDQLGVAGKWIYDQVINTSTFQYTFIKQFSFSSDLHYTETDYETVKDKVTKDIEKGVRALSLEKPTEVYWLKLEYNILTSPVGSPANKINVSVTFQNADYDTFGTDKNAADAEISTALSTIKTSLTGDRAAKIKTIHDTLCNTLTYDKGEDGKTCKVRSAYTSLVNDKHVVCEGYAKAFKAICDDNSIPCLIMTGDAGTKTQSYGPHMWNYVMLDNGCWYLVDVTWDDQSSIKYEYYLAGTESVGYDDTTIGKSHDPTIGASSTVTGYGFTVPTLSATSANDPSYIVTFMNEGSVFTKVAVKQDTKMTALSEKPTKPGYFFLRWCVDEGLTTPWDWNNVVTGNMSLYAEYTANPVRITLVDGDKSSYIYVEKGVPTKLTELATPEGNGKTFKGWNTAKDGTGIYYTTEDTVTLNDDMNLYAIWEQQSDDPVINTLNKINEFLAGNSVVKGISNTVLAIAVCSGVLLLIGFLLIRIKK